LLHNFQETASKKVLSIVDLNQARSDYIYSCQQLRHQGLA